MPDETRMERLAEHVRQLLPPGAGGAQSHSSSSACLLSQEILTENPVATGGRLKERQERAKKHLQKAAEGWAKWRKQARKALLLYKTFMEYWKLETAQPKSEWERTVLPGPGAHTYQYS